MKKAIEQINDWMSRLLIMLATAFSMTMAAHAAQTVYKYIGPNGAVVYSDTPPTNTEDFEEITLPDYPPADLEAHKQTMDEIAKTIERLQTDRRERENDEEKARPPAPPVVYYPQPEANPAPYYYPRYPYRYKQHYPRPPYRIERNLDSRERQLERLRSPITIPGFGRGETTQDRYIK